MAQLILLGAFGQQDRFGNLKGLTLFKLCGFIVNPDRSVREFFFRYFGIETSLNPFATKDVYIYTMPYLRADCHQRTKRRRSL